MGFVRVTDPDRALEYWKAGLLYEQWRGVKQICKANSWQDGAVLRECRSGEEWHFHIYLED